LRSADRQDNPPPHDLFLQVINYNLCPKALAENIPEYVVLRDVLQRGAKAGWPYVVWMQTWIVLQGIRGQQGVEEAKQIMGIGLPCWDTDAYCQDFCDAWLARYEAAVKRTGRAAVFSHEEGLAQGMSGHHFVQTLRSSKQINQIRQLAIQLQRYTAENFAAKEVLEVKDLINASGLLLRMPTKAKEGAGLASRTGYNGMNWTRILSLLLSDVFGAKPVAFTEEMWDKMLQCQGGHGLNEALQFFNVSTYIAANNLMRHVTTLTWELLFVAICESRQAWQYFKDNGERFRFIVKAVANHRLRYTRTINDLTKMIVNRGAKARKCFSVRLFIALCRRLRRRDLLRQHAEGPLWRPSLARLQAAAS